MHLQIFFLETSSGQIYFFVSVLAQCSCMYEKISLFFRPNPLNTFWRLSAKYLSSSGHNGAFCIFKNWKEIRPLEYMSIVQISPARGADKFDLKALQNIPDWGGIKSGNKNALFMYWAWQVMIVTHWKYKSLVGKFIFPLLKTLRFADSQILSQFRGHSVLWQKQKD